MKDRQLREKFGKAGRKRVEEQFSWTSIAQKTKALYKTLVEDGVPRTQSAGSVKQTL